MPTSSAARSSRSSGAGGSSRSPGAMARRPLRSASASGRRSWSRAGRREHRARGSGALAFAPGAGRRGPAAAAAAASPAPLPRHGAHDDRRRRPLAGDRAHASEAFAARRPRHARGRALPHVPPPPRRRDPALLPARPALPLPARDVRRLHPHPLAVSRSPGALRHRRGRPVGGFLCRARRDRRRAPPLDGPSHSAPRRRPRARRLAAHRLPRPPRAPRRPGERRAPPGGVRRLVRALRHLREPPPRGPARRRPRALRGGRAAHPCAAGAADRLPRVARAAGLAGLARLGGDHPLHGGARAPADARRRPAARRVARGRGALEPRPLRAHVRRRTVQDPPMSSERPSWDQYFLTITRQVAERSTCLRAKVGAVIVRDRNILATGYNGAPAGLPHCTDVGCLIYTSQTPTGEIEENCFRTIHAEINAIAQAAKNGVSIRGADIYITHTPCIHCLKVLINTGIRRVFYEREYKLHTLSELLRWSDVRLERVVL